MRLLKLSAKRTGWYTECNTAQKGRKFAKRFEHRHNRRHGRKLCREITE